ncbi:MAG: hypothetical protein ACPGNT_07785 [Rhodospirillales bacterium]
MKSFTVLRRESAEGADILLIPEDRSLKAALFGPLWALLAGDFWLAAVMAGAGGLLFGLMALLGADGAGCLVGYLGLAAAWGLFAQDGRRLFAEARGFRPWAIVAGSNLDDAERRLFEADDLLVWDLKP